jgi:MoxR-like ATPase
MDLGLGLRPVFSIFFPITNHRLTNHLFKHRPLTFFYTPQPIFTQDGVTFGKHTEIPLMTTATTDVHALNERIKQESSFVDKINAELDHVIVGQKTMIERLLIALLSNGHILLEGVPGLAKTLAVKSLASTIHADFSRIQFTPDLLPADLVGTMIYNQKADSFTVRKGPVFANFVLADEINRAPAKVQSALLEAMQERQVTIGDETFKLPEPFLVLATMNPIEQEGTYPLPEAQVDRFMLKVVIKYPTKEEEQAIIRQQLSANRTSPKAILTPADILRARNVVQDVYLDEKIEKYIVDIVFATRYPEQYRLQKLTPLISFGGSPRASISLAQAAKSYAFLQHRGFVIPDDIRAVAFDVLRHRIGLTYEAEAENVTTENIIREVLAAVQVP